MGFKVRGLEHKASKTNVIKEQKDIEHKASNVITGQKDIGEQSSVDSNEKKGYSGFVTFFIGTALFMVGGACGFALCKYLPSKLYSLPL